MKRISNSSQFRHLGLAIKILRELKNISQAQLAGMAGMGKSQLSKYESGKELPKLDSLDKILVALSATPFSLLLVVNFLDRMRSGRPPHLLWLEAPLGPLLSDSEEEAFTSFIRSLYGLFQAKTEHRLHLMQQHTSQESLGVDGGNDGPRSLG